MVTGVSHVGQSPPTSTRTQGWWQSWQPAAAPATRGRLVPHGLVRHIDLPQSPARVTVLATRAVTSARACPNPAPGAACSSSMESDPTGAATRRSPPPEPLSGHRAARRSSPTGPPLTPTPRAAAAAPRWTACQTPGHPARQPHQDQINARPNDLNSYDQRDLLRQGRRHPRQPPRPAGTVRAVPARAARLDRPSDLEAGSLRSRSWTAVSPAIAPESGHPEPGRIRRSLPGKGSDTEGVRSRPASTEALPQSSWSRLTPTENALALDLEAGC